MKLRITKKNGKQHTVNNVTQFELDEIGGAYWKETDGKRRGLVWNCRQRDEIEKIEIIL